MAYVRGNDAENRLGPMGRLMATKTKEIGNPNNNYRKYLNKHGILKQRLNNIEGRGYLLILYN